MKRPASVTPAEVTAIGRIDPPKFLQKLSTLADVLCQPVWEEDEHKGESALFLFRSGVTWRAILKVEKPPLSLTVPGRNLDELLAALELALRSEDVPWVQDPNPLGKRDAKRKRGA